MKRENEDYFEQRNERERAREMKKRREGRRTDQVHFPNDFQITLRCLQHNNQDHVGGITHALKFKKKKKEEIIRKKKWTSQRGQTRSFLPFSFSLSHQDGVLSKACEQQQQQVLPQRLPPGAQFFLSSFLSSGLIFWICTNKNRIFANRREWPRVELSPSPTPWRLSRSDCSCRESWLERETM